MTTPETVYRALTAASETICQHAYRQQLGKRRRLRKFYPPIEATDLITASSDVLTGRLSVNDAMAMLHYGNTAESLRRARTK